MIEAESFASAVATNRIRKDTPACDFLREFLGFLETAQKSLNSGQKLLYGLGISFAIAALRAADNRLCKEFQFDFDE